MLIPCPGNTENSTAGIALPTKRIRKLPVPGAPGAETPTSPLPIVFRTGPMMQRLTLGWTSSLGHAAGTPGRAGACPETGFAGLVPRSSRSPLSPSCSRRMPPRDCPTSSGSHSVGPPPPTRLRCRRAPSLPENRCPPRSPRIRELQPMARRLEPGARASPSERTVTIRPRDPIFLPISAVGSPPSISELPLPR